MAALVMALALCLLVFSGGMPMMDEGSPGPRFLPVVMAAGLALLSVLYALECLATGKGREARKVLPANIRPILYVGSALVIVPLWDSLGAVVTILAVGLFQFRAIEKFRWTKAAVAAVVMSASTFVLFRFVLGINLPVGPFEWLLPR